MKRIAIIDSHTGGEPTRVVISGGPDLGGGSVADRLKVFRDRHDQFRSAVVNEPRGSDVLVGALLVASSDKSCVAGVIFFNNVGYLGMCGHGTIGLMATLAHMAKIGPGEHRLETPVGVVTAVLNRDGSVSVGNVDSYRKAKDVAIDVPGAGLVKGDVAWGGNWFYLVTDHGQCLELVNVEQLTNFTWKIRQAVNAQGFPEVDHVELLGPPGGAGAHSRNFVLCPGKAYDRSPCGTGTSAKLACLAADGMLVEGTEHVVESLIGSRFVGKFTWVDRAKGIIAPNITGTAHVNAEATLLLDEHDPYCWGIGDGARVSNPPGPRKSIPREEARGGTEGAAACNAFGATPGSPERLPVSGSRLGQSRSERVGHPRSDADYVRELVAARQARHSPTIPDAEIQAGFKGWHSRGYLPHFDRRGVYQFLTIRLADALPQERRREWSELLKIEDDKKRFTKVETYLDKGYGRCELRIPEVAALVQTALLKFDGERYRLLGWCIMPNHLHVLVEVTQVPLKKILHSWKTFTSLQANRLLGRTGAFWQADYFDRFMRDGEHLQKTLRYITANPVKAGLVKDAREWEWGSARFADSQIDCHAGVQPATRLAIVAGDKEG